MTEEQLIHSCKNVALGHRRPWSFAVHCGNSVEIERRSDALYNIKNRKSQLQNREIRFWDFNCTLALYFLNQYVLGGIEPRFGYYDLN